MMSKEQLVCIICEKKPACGMWMYVWKEKQGYACRECGERFHIIGDYLVQKAVDMLESQGIKVMQCKEKFGEWRIYLDTYTPLAEKTAKDLETQFKILFPEFNWAFD